MNLYHKEQFRDVKELIIEGTEKYTGNTDDLNAIKEWSKATGHIPLYYERDYKDGIHVEVSEVYDVKIKHALSNGSAIGADGRKYTFVTPDKIYPTGGSMCTRAIPEGSDTSDVYGLDFFV